MSLVADSTPQLYGPELAERIRALRQKAAVEPLTLEESREAISLLRAGRVSAADKAAKAKARKAKPKVDADALLQELM